MSRADDEEQARHGIAHVTVRLSQVRVCQPSADGECRCPHPLPQRQDFITATSHTALLPHVTEEQVEDTLARAEKALRSDILAKAVGSFVDRVERVRMVNGDIDVRGFFTMKRRMDA